MAIAIKDKTRHVMDSIPKNWTGENLDKELFRAFERGEEYQKKKDAEEWEERVKTNLSKATTLSETIFHTAYEDYKVKIKKALLKIDNIEHFETLFIVDRETYFSENLKEVYKKSFSIKKDFNCDSFRIDFKFMPSSENLNIELINSDGFVFSYGQE